MAFNPKRGQPIPEEEEKKIVKLLKETDLSYEVIGRRFGRSDNTISKICKKHQARVGRKTGKGNGNPAFWGGI